MTVAFMRRLARDRQERVADVWLRLRRNPLGSYSSEAIAEAILNRHSADGKLIQLIGKEAAGSPQWYRRYRLNDLRRNRPKPRLYTRVPVRRPNRKLPAAA